MAKVSKLWEGLTTTGLSGTYIRPHNGGYAFGRWYKQHWGGYRFEHLGDRSSVEAARLALEAVDKAVERRTRELNKRRKRHG
jgi:hypothetical protein